MEDQTPLGEPQGAPMEQTETSYSDNSDAVFDELFQIPQNSTYTEENTPSVTSEVSAPMVDDSTTTDSYKYWQSEADKRTNERDEIFRTLGVDNVDSARRVMDEMRDVMPIAKYVKGNKEVLDVVEASLRGEPIGNQGKPDNQPTQVEKPVKPVQPQGYSDMDAWQEPESESYKYRTSVESYRDAMLEHNQMENAQLRDNIRMAQEQQARNGEINTLKVGLQGQYGYTPEQANDFIEWSNQDQSFTVENLIQLHGMVRGISQQQPSQVQQGQPLVEPQVERKVQEMIAQRQRLAQPGGVGHAGGGDNQTVKPAEDIIMNDLVSSDRQQNPWT